MQQIDFGQFFQMDMKSQLIVSLVLPPLSDDHHVKTFKIMPRSSHAHAYVNAGLCARVDHQDSCRIVGEPTLVFGGMSPSFTHARKTEQFLSGKCVTDVTVLRSAMSILDQELNPEADLLAPDVSYRKSVAQGLLYKVRFKKNLFIT